MITHFFSGNENILGERGNDPGGQGLRHEPKKEDGGSKGGDCGIRHKVTSDL